MSDQTPLLAATGARIAVDDVIAIDGFTLATRGDRVLFVGDAAVLFSALSGVPLLAAAPDHGTNEPVLAGETRVVGGEMLFFGLDVAAQAHLAACGFAPLDPPVPRSMSAFEYLVWAARLAGVTPGAARDLAKGALERVGLQTMGARPAAALGLAERRALQLAKAIVHDPPAIVAEAPLDRLEGQAASFTLGALAAATEGRRALLSARSAEPGSPEGTLARSASHLVFLGDGGAILEGTPDVLAAGTRVYRLTVTSHAEAYREALAARGIALQAGPLHFLVTLPKDATTAPLLQAASEARAAVVELVPIVGA